MLCASIHTYRYCLHYSRLQSRQSMIPALLSGQSRYRQPDNLSVNTLYFSGFKNIIYFESHTVYRACEIKCTVPCFTSRTNTPTYVCLFGLQVIRLPIGHEEYSFLFSQPFSMILIVHYYTVQFCTHRATFTTS